MKRTTISLPDDLAACLEHEAQRSGTSASHVTRQALSAYLGLEGDKPRRLAFAALGSSGFKHTARDVEKILTAEWEHAGDRRCWPALCCR
ncbi:MAG TPA: CopG family transcriptional regulator [Chloroflexota bacterium]|nr:CopG family transcriptional regulator [Chloroflexota bacterium]